MTQENETKVLEHGFILPVSCTFNGEADKLKLRTAIDYLFAQIPEDISQVRVQFSEPRQDIESGNWQQTLGIRWFV